MEEVLNHLDDFDNYSAQFEDLISKIDFKNAPIESQKELNDLKASLSSWEDKLKELKDAAQERNDDNIKEIIHLIKQRKKNLKSLKSLLRKKNLKMREYSAVFESLDRNSLFEKSDSKTLVKDSSSLKLSQNINEDLKRITSLMVNEIDHGHGILGELEDQGKFIDAVNNKFDDITETIKTGRNHTSKLSRKEHLYIRLTRLSFLFFIFVCIYIIASRLKIIKLVVDVSKGVYSSFS